MICASIWPSSWSITRLQSRLWLCLSIICNEEESKIWDDELTYIVNGYGASSRNTLAYHNRCNHHVDMDAIRQIQTSCVIAENDGISALKEVGESFSLNGDNRHQVEDREYHSKEAVPSLRVYQQYNPYVHFFQLIWNKETVAHHRQGE